MDGEKLLLETLNTMKQEVSKPSYDTWFARAQFLKQEGNILYIDTENEFQRDWLEGRYSKRINEIIKELSNNDKLVVSYVYSSNYKPRDTVSSGRHFGQEKTLIDRIQTLEEKVQTLESDIAEMKRDN